MCLQAFMSLARVDPDVAWCKLRAALEAHGSMPSTVSNAVDTTADFGRGQLQLLEGSWMLEGIRLRVSNKQLTFAALSEISPAPPTASSPGTQAGALGGRHTRTTTIRLSFPTGMQECSSIKLLAMMQQAEQLPLRWHKQVEALLQQH